MKKVLALVLALAMVFSTITVAFADATTTAAPETTAAEISAAAKTCADLGMLQGPSGTVDVAYTSTEPTRIQAAIMLLRLKGLEADAKAFTGEDNFADVAADYWAKPITAFLKAHPELGFIGDGKSFKANDKMDAKQYAKVLLTALGYNQTSAEVVGDYTWEGVVEFAKSKSLTLADSATFSIDVLAQATVEALKATAKDGGKTLAASLVESGKMDAAKAEANGLYTAEKINIADDKVAPSVTKIESDDTNTIEVTFNKPVEKASAGNKDNYTVKRSGTTLAIKAIDVKGNKAVITTEGMENAKTYTMTVENVKNLSGVAMKEKYSDTFTGTIDKKAPDLKKVTAKSNIRINLEFNEELDKASAETVANYKITGAKGDLEIKSVKLIKNDDKNDKDNYDDYTWVEIITAPQKSGKYTVHAINIADDSVSLNKIAKEDTEDFSGKSKETSAPKLETSSDVTRTLSSNKVLLTFKDESRINFETATNPSNYSFNNDLKVESVEMLDATDDDCMAVVITTSEQDDDKSYTITVKNVEDELGNSMDSKGVKASVGKGKTDDQSAPGIAKIWATDTDEVRVQFTELVDKASAENIDNYDFGTLGIEKAELDNDKKTVIITTAGEMENKYYSVNIKGIKDLNENAMVEETEGINNAAFVGYLDDDTLDIEHPEIDYVDVESRTEIKIGFTEKVRVTAKNIDTPWLAPYCEGNGQPIIKFAELDNSGKPTANTVTAKFVGGWYTYGTGVGGYSEDGKVLELKVPDGALKTNKDYRVVELTNVTDWAGNTVPQSWINDNNDDFDVSGSESYSDMAEFDSIDQVRADRIDVTFTKPVKLKTTADNYTLAADANYTYAKYSNNGVTFKVVVRPANPCVARFSVTGGIAEKTYNFDLSGLFESLQGYDAMDDDDTADSVNKLENSGKDKTEYVANSVDKDAPVVEEVTAIDSQTIKVVFDKNVDPLVGNYKLKWTDDENKKGNCTLTADSMWSGGNTAYVNMPEGKTMDVDYDYTLTVSNVKDRYNNVIKSDDFDFDAVENTANGLYVAGVEQINGTKANVYLSKAWLRNYYNEGNQLTKVYDQTTKNTYTVPANVGALIQYNRGWNNDANFEDPVTDDFIFDIYAGNQTYVKQAESVKDDKAVADVSAALVDAKGKALPAFYAGGVFDLIAKDGSTIYTWTVDEAENMDGGITLDGTTLTFDDADTDENTIVEAYNAKTNALIAVSKNSSGSVAAAGGWAEIYSSELSGKVIFVVKKNNNVIHAKSIDIATPVKLVAATTTITDIAGDAANKKVAVELKGIKNPQNYKVTCKGVTLVYNTVTGMFEANVPAADALEANIKVEDVSTVTGVTLDKTTAQVSIGGTVTLKATVEPATAQNKNVTWTSSDEKVATVDKDGLVKGIGEGKATITVTTEDGDKTATCEVTVIKEVIPVAEVTISKTTANVETGKTVTLTATVKPDNATNKTVTWTTSDATVATVADGVVTGVKAGTATITATADGKTATCTVTVKEPIVTVSKALKSSFSGLNMVSVTFAVNDNTITADNITVTVNDGTVLDLEPGTSFVYSGAPAGNLDDLKTVTIKITKGAEVNEQVVDLTLKAD